MTMYVVGNFYLDIETSGLDATKDKIITIQFVELERNTGKQIGELKILKEWELGEKEVLRQFIIQSSITNSYAFSFVSVGYNLGFEHNFLLERCKVHDLDQIDILHKPFLDLRSVGILMNKGEFKGSGLDKITGKPQNGSMIPQWYTEKKYSEIENYIKIEALEFINFHSWLYGELPSLLEKFKTENNLKQKPL